MSKKESFVVIPDNGNNASVHPTLPGALDRVSKDVGTLNETSKKEGRKLLEGGELPKKGASFSGDKGNAKVIPAEASP